MSTQGSDRGLLDGAGPHLAVLALWVGVFCFAVLWGGDTWFFHDLRHHHYPWRSWAADSWAAGEIPLWAPVGHGFPLLADGQTGVLYPVNVLLYAVLPTSAAFTWGIVGHWLWGAWGAYVLARFLRRSPNAAFIAGLAWGFSGFAVSHLVYLGMFEVLAWIPWMLACGKRAVDTGRPGWWIAGGMATGLSWLCGHPQLALYGAVALAVCVVWWTVEARAWWALAGLAALVGIAVAIASPQLLASWELSGQGMRAGGLDPVAAGLGSLPPEELVNGVFPTPLGFERPADIAVSYHHRGGGYVGRGVSYWEDAFYLGIPVVILAVAAGVVRRARLWWLLVAVGVVVMLGDNTPLFHVWRWIPGMSWFRFPVRAAVWVVLGMAMLSAVGFDRVGGLVRGAPERVGRAASWLGVGVVGVVVLLAIGRVVLEVAPVESVLAARFAEDHGEEAADRAQAIVAELQASTAPWSGRVLWPVGIALLGVVGLGLAARGRIAPASLGPYTAMVLAVDLAVFGVGFNPTSPPEALERPPSVLPMVGEPGPFRATVLDRRGDAALDTVLLSANLGLLWDLEDVIIPSPLRTSRNEAYLERVGLDLGLAPDPVGRFLANRHLADLSGVRFLTTTHRVHADGLDEVWTDGEVRVYRNDRALPRAFAVGCTRTADAATALDAVVALDDPAAVAVVEGDGLAVCAPGPAGQVSVERRGRSELVVRADMDRAGLIVITESYYPGQELWVDGRRSERVRADYLFQGVIVSAGEHEVRLRYRPRWLLAAALVSALTITGCLAGLLALSVVWVRRLVWSPPG